MRSSVATRSARYCGVRRGNRTLARTYGMEYNNKDLKKIHKLVSTHHNNKQCCVVCSKITKSAISISTTDLRRLRFYVSN